MNIGEIINGKYDILKELGEGGMGKVFEVSDISNGDTYALKFCKEKEESAIRRFAREVRIMSETVHPNIISILESNLSNDPPYFLMPIAVTTLKDLITTIKGNVDKIFFFFNEICQGISAMHNSGHFHRDIKPSNVLIMQNGQIVISDFGLSKKLIKDSSTHSSSNNFIGTLGYHAPEQWEGKSADARTDVYQLGKTLYELFTGDYPHLINPIKISPSLNYIIQKATSIDPDDRYQTVSDLQQAFNSYKLSLDPDANPYDAYTNRINEVNNLLKQGQYTDSACLALLEILDKVKDDSKVFVEFFDRISNRILKIFSNTLGSQFEGTFKLYNKNLHEYIKESFVDFSYAETVAEKMAAIFSATLRLDFKIYAIKNTLNVSVWFNRFAAMDVLDNLLKSVKSNDEAVAVADLLRTELDHYSKVYNRIPKNNLHFILQKLWEEVDTAEKEQKEKQDKETQEWIKSTRLFDF